MRNWILICIAALCIYSCQRVDDDNVDEFESEGVVLGVDLTQCACCGGFLTKFDGRDETFLFVDLPSNSTLDLAAQNFPVNIRANWTEGVSEACPLFISIEDIELAE